MCEQKPDTRSKVEKLIDAMERLSAALERQSIKDRGHNWRYPSTANYGGISGDLINNKRP